MISFQRNFNVEDLARQPLQKHARNEPIQVAFMGEDNVRFGQHLHALTLAENAENVKTLTNILKQEKNPDLKLAAAKALWWMGKEEGVAAALEDCLKDKDWIGAPPEITLLRPVRA